MVRDWEMRISPRVRRMIPPDRAGAKVTVLPGSRIFHGLAQGDPGAAAEGAVVLIGHGGDDGALGRERENEKGRQEEAERGHGGMRFTTVVRVPIDGPS